MCRRTAEEDGPSLDPPHGPVHHHGPHGRLGQAPLQETLRGGGGLVFAVYFSKCLGGTSHVVQCA